MSIAATAKAPGFVGFFTPVAQRVLKVGALLGPNALITIRGRKSGQPRTTPVALVEIGGKRWVIGTFGETNWVRNLRAAGKASISVGKRHENVAARELSVEERAAFFRAVLTPYVRSLLVGGLLLAVLGAREVLDDPEAAARTRPVFELRTAEDHVRHHS